MVFFITKFQPFTFKWNNTRRMIYFDFKNDGSSKVQSDDIQINIGAHGKTRIFVGSNGTWGSWNGLLDYEINLRGTLNDATDEDNGYSVELMIPYAQVGIDKNSMFGVAVGHVARGKDSTHETLQYTWGGLVYEGSFVDPQVPRSYIVSLGNEFYSRGNLPVGNVNVNAGSTVCVYARFSTIYTTEFDVVSEQPYTLPAYNGNFPIGEYKFTEGTYEQVFDIIPAKSYTSFYWSVEGSVAWHAAYDPESKIFSIDGMIYGMEDVAAANGLTSFYGLVLTTSDTAGFAYFNTATADSEEMCPTQIQVGENGLEKLLTYYTAFNCELVENKWTPVSKIFEFTPEAVIAPYVAEEETPETGDETVEPEASALSISASYPVVSERVEVVKPYYGEVKRSFAPATLKR